MIPSRYPSARPHALRQTYYDGVRPVGHFLSTKCCRIGRDEHHGDVCDRRRQRAFIEQVLFFPEECQGRGVVGHSKARFECGDALLLLQCSTAQHGGCTDCSTRT